MLSALTLLPSLLFTFGRAAFWPRRPKYEPEGVESEHGVHTTGLWAWLGRHIRRAARPMWLITAIVLAIGVAGARTDRGGRRRTAPRLGRSRFLIPDRSGDLLCQTRRDADGGLGVVAAIDARSDPYQFREASVEGSQ